LGEFALGCSGEQFHAQVGQDSQVPQGMLAECIQEWRGHEVWVSVGGQEVFEVR